MSIGHPPCKTWQVALGGVYGLVLGTRIGGPAKTSLSWSSLEANVLALIAILAVIICMVLAIHPLGRQGLRIIAVGHIVVSLLGFRVFLRAAEVESQFAPEIWFYTALNVSIPLAVAVFVVTPRPLTEADQNLPKGWDHLKPGYHRLSVPQRLLFVVLASVTVPTLGTGNIFLAIFAIPLISVIYAVVAFLRDPGKAKLFGSARNVRLSPKMQKPAQRRSYWTIDDSEYDDPDKYEQ